MYVLECALVVYPWNTSSTYRLDRCMCWCVLQLCIPGIHHQHTDSTDVCVGVCFSCVSLEYIINIQTRPMYVLVCALVVYPWNTSSTYRLDRCMCWCVLQLCIPGIHYQHTDSTDVCVSVCFSCVSLEYIINIQTRPMYVSECALVVYPWNTSSTYRLDRCMCWCVL